jgi:hypothetical protein
MGRSQLVVEIQELMSQINHQTEDPAGTERRYRNSLLKSRGVEKWSRCPISDGYGEGGGIKGIRQKHCANNAIILFFFALPKKM